MPYRLSHLSHLSRENYLLILSKAFKGFSQLYSTNGPFLVKEAMIGINFVGQVKVWPNENYAVNCAKADVRYRSESSMVR